jgi:hypothetical protein
MILIEKEYKKNGRGSGELTKSIVGAIEVLSAFRSDAGRLIEIH